MSNKAYAIILGICFLVVMGSGVSIILDLRSINADKSTLLETGNRCQGYTIMQVQRLPQTDAYLFMNSDLKKVLLPTLEATAFCAKG